MSEFTTQYINPVINELEIKSANNNTIYLTGIVDEHMSTKFSYFCDKIVRMNELKDTPNYEIRLLFASWGGSVDFGNVIIGKIRALQQQGYKFIGIVESMAFSMAYDILIHCDRRIGYKYSQYLLHQTSFGVGGELKEIARAVDYQKKLWNISVDYYVANTKLTRERVEEIYDRKENYFFTAEEALENGSIHEIIG